MKSQEDTVDIVTTAVAEFLGMDPASIPGDVNLILLGLRSLDVMRLSSRWRRDGIPVEFDALVADPTLESWRRHVDEVRGTGR